MGQTATWGSGVQLKIPAAVQARRLVIVSHYLLKGEARNPGPQKLLRQILASVSQSMNRFEILSSDDELEVPTTVPASPGAVVGLWRLQQCKPDVW